MMQNERLFMEMRLLRMFCEKYGMSSKQANEIFELYGIWQFIETSYDALHVSGDECALHDIIDILHSKGCEL